MAITPSEILSRCRAEAPFLLSVRRHLHTHPELSGQEIQTIQYIAETLNAMGIQPEIIPEGGILARIHGEKAPSPAPALLMRADCDALPVEERPHPKSPRVCTSQNPGVCHACGHDVHSAVLLTAAKVLQQYRKELRGDVVLLIERSEEIPFNKCLLRLMEAIEQRGQRIDGAWGMHCAPSPAGTIQLNSGAVMAGTLFFRFTLTGKGGHGSRPDLSVSPIDCFTAIHSALQRIPSRYSPFLPATLSITQVQAGNTDNVIPQSLAFGGTARFFDSNQVGFPIQAEINRTVREIAAAYGCHVEGTASAPFLPLQNHPACVELAREVFQPVFGERVNEDLPSMVSETFATLAARYPAVFIHYGVCNPEKGITAGLHHPEFDVEESVLADAAGAAAIYAHSFLERTAAETDWGFAPYRESAKELFALQGITDEKRGD